MVLIYFLDQHSEAIKQYIKSRFKYWPISGAGRKTACKLSSGVPDSRETHCSVVRRLSAAAAEPSEHRWPDASTNAVQGVLISRCREPSVPAMQSDDASGLDNYYWCLVIGSQT